MAFGYFGGRFALANPVLSRGIMLAQRWRLLSLRARNRLRPRQRVNLTIENDHDVLARDFEQFLRQGYRRVNIGGGNKNLAGFVNIDFVRHPSVERELVANVLDLAFIPDGCLEQVHSNHVMEHLPEGAIVEQLDSYHRILAPGSLLTVRCPNALGAAYAFWFQPVLEEDAEEFLRLGFPPDETLADPRDRWGHQDFYGFLHWIHGDVGNPKNEHATLVTPTKMKRWLETAGFDVLKMAQPEAINIVAVARRT